MTQKAEITYRRVLESADVAFVVIPGGGNRRTRGKPPILDGRPLSCHMPIPGFDPGSQRWQASAFTTAHIRHFAITVLKSNSEHDSKYHAEHCLSPLVFENGSEYSACRYEIFVP